MAPMAGAGAASAPHAAGPGVTGAVPVAPHGAGVAPAGALVGTTVGRGRYSVDRLLGRGGMSAVYLARDRNLSDRLVAVKEMVDAFASPQERAEAERDFAREADLLAALHHPAIPAILDRFSEQRRHLLVMEYIAGETLDTKLLVHGPFEEEQVRAWALALCPVLSYLHAQTPPVVFRDLKPANIMVQPDGRVRLIDFGIARLFKPQQKADTVALGTSGYASPEHYTGQTDARSDIYSLGATLHHLLTGRDPSKHPPFAFPPVRSLAPGISSDLANAVDRAVRSDREKRFATIDDMCKALQPKGRRAKSSASAATASPAPTAAATLAPASSQTAPPRQPVVPAPPVAAPARARSVPATATVARPAASTAPATVAAPAVARAQVLVLETLHPQRRIDAAAIAAQVAAWAGVDMATLRAEIARGLPLTLALPTHTGVGPGVVAANSTALGALGARARVVTPSIIPVLPDGDLRRRLNTTRQLVVRDAIIGADRICRCRRCGYKWQTTKSVGDPVPLRCPNCRSTEWGRWRILKCAWCGHEFETPDVQSRPDRLFPTCPCCGLPNWETGRPAARTGWLDRILAAIAGAS